MCQKVFVRILLVFFFVRSSYPSISVHPFVQFIHLFILHFKLEYELRQRVYYVYLSSLLFDITELTLSHSNFPILCLCYTFPYSEQFTLSTSTIININVFFFFHFPLLANVNFVCVCVCIIRYTHIMFIKSDLWKWFGMCNWSIRLYVMYYKIHCIRLTYWILSNFVFSSHWIGYCNV